MFGRERLIKVIEKFGDRSVSELHAAVLDALNDYLMLRTCHSCFRRVGRAQRNLPCNCLICALPTLQAASGCVT